MGGGGVEGASCGADSVPVGGFRTRAGKAVEVAAGSLVDVGVGPSGGVGEGLLVAAGRRRAAGVSAADPSGAPGIPKVGVSGSGVGT